VNALLLSAALLLGAAPIADGSLLFLENSNQFVELYTGSETTHVAVILHDKEQPWVYEATPGEVRKLTFDAYRSELGELNKRRGEKRKIRAVLVESSTPYSEPQITAMRELLESQIGRRYSIKGHVRGRSDGIHCAELAARALCAASVLKIERCQAESPATLLERVKPQAQPLTTLVIKEPEERPSWAARRWNDISAFAGWCQWSCWESWTWCW
jgi:hypothetical protein